MAGMNMQQMMKQARKMQEQLAAAQERDRCPAGGLAHRVVFAGYGWHSYICAS